MTNGLGKKEAAIELSEQRGRICKSPQMLCFILLVIIAGILFGGATFFKNSMSDGLHQLLMGIGIAIGPAALLSMVFRVFLLVDIKKELMSPLTDLEDRTAKVLEEKVEESFRPIVERVDLLAHLEKLGVVFVYENRQVALRYDSSFYHELEKENESIEIIGSSLRGVLQKNMYRDIKELLIGKISIIKFMVTHPCVADLRAFQENRRPGDIPTEILETLTQLRDLGVKPEAVRLYRGTPTCFAIKTSTRMLINPYPYTRQAMDSPCFELVYGHPIYDAFSGAHFNAFDTEFAVRFDNFDNIIKSLKDNIKVYSTKSLCMLEKISSRECKI